MEDPLACVAVRCSSLTDHDIAWCEKEHCPFAHQRRRLKDREERARKDRREPLTPVNPERSESCQ